MESVLNAFAHVLRWDAAVNHIQNVLQAIFFFHPLIWWVNRMVRREREKCCDEVVLSMSCMSPKVYCEAIINMVASARTLRQSTPTLAVTGSTKNIEERITTMLTPNREFRRRPSRTAAASILLVASCVLPTALVVKTNADIGASQEQSETTDSKDTQGSHDTGAQGDGTWQAGQILDFRVIHADTKLPLADATLHLQNMGPGIDFQDVTIQRTDADGWSRITLPDVPPTAVRVYLVKEGFVPLRVYWAAEPHPTLAKSITVPMVPGKEFGGTVRNEAGEPIPDVTVTVHYYESGKGDNPHIRANIKSTTTTDRSGRWHVNVMPAEIDDEQSLRIYLHHPDYVSDSLKRGVWPMPVTKQPVLRELYDQTAEMVMQRGGTIAGKVVDYHGQPIPKAAIYDDELYWLNPGVPRAITDGDGEFRMAGVAYGEDVSDAPDSRPRTLTIQAAGYAPEMVSVVPQSSTIVVQLQSGSFVHGQIVDDTGNPVARANVRARRWRETDDRLHLQTLTDAEGRFQLQDVPTDSVEYDVSREGYMSVSGFSMSPSNREYHLTLWPVVRIVGTVVDAANGKPLDQFVLIPGTDRENGRTTFWHRWAARTIEQKGQYATALAQAGFNWRLRVEADGYMPEVSRIFRPYNPDKGEIHYAFQLTKSPPIVGTVLGLDSTPLANADVYLATQAMNLNKRKVSAPDARRVRTDAEGRFQFPTEIEPFCLVVVHEQGVAMITEKECANPVCMTLKPWTNGNETLQIIRNPSRGVHKDYPVE